MRDERTRDKKLYISGNIANQFYLKIKQWCPNFTFYNLARKDVKCFWFSEDQINNLCALTCTSCVIDYLSNNRSIEEKKYCSNLFRRMRIIQNHMG